MSQTFGLYSVVCFLNTPTRTWLAVMQFQSSVHTAHSCASIESQQRMICDSQIITNCRNLFNSMKSDLKKEYSLIQSLKKRFTLCWICFLYFSSGKKECRAPLPPITELPSSTLPAKTGFKKWNSNPVIHKDFSERTFPLARKLPDSEEHREAFLRSTEHILATFYGLVFIIEGAEWHILKSEYLPIYFVRVSVKDVKYPFRILVIDNESEKHVRVRKLLVVYYTDQWCY